MTEENINNNEIIESNTGPDIGPKGETVIKHGDENKIIEGSKATGK